MPWQVTEVRGAKITLENLKSYWLAGTTCHGYHSVFWVSECDQFILMKHTGHSGWSGRMLGLQYCATKYSLFVVGEEFPDIMGDSSHWDYKGRWSKARMVEVQEVIDQILAVE